MGNGFITPISLNYVVASVIMQLIFCIYYGYRKLMFLNPMTITSVVLNCFGVLFNNYTHIKQKKNNILMIIKIQNAQRALKMNPMKFRSLITCNRIFVVGLNLYYFAIVVYYLSYLYSVFDVFITFFEYFACCFDINLLYAIVMMKLLADCLENWIADVKKTRLDTDLLTDMNLNTKFDIFMETFEAY